MPQPTTPKAKYSAAGEGNVYARANTATCKVTAADTDGTYEIFDEICKPGFESRLHMHVKSFQVCYVVDGSGEFQLGDEVFHAKKGACVNIPPGTPHKVGSKEGMRMLMVYSPPRPRGHDGGDEGAFAGAAQGWRADVENPRGPRHRRAGRRLGQQGLGERVGLTRYVTSLCKFRTGNHYSDRKHGTQNPLAA